MGEYILHYPPIKNLMPPASFHHSEISELYYVTRGEGTTLTRRRAGKPSVEAGEHRQFQAGERTRRCRHDQELYNAKVGTGRHHYRSCGSSAHHRLRSHRDRAARLSFAAYFFENRFRFRTSSRFFFSILSASKGSKSPARTRSLTACSNRAAYVSKFPYRSSIDRRGSALSMRSTFVFGNGIYWPAASQPSSLWGAARRAHPV